jgi:hypothetical protein
MLLVRALAHCRKSSGVLSGVSIKTLNHSSSGQLESAILRGITVSWYSILTVIFCFFLFIGIAMLDVAKRKTKSVFHAYCPEK